jgi:hypothetical protein
LPKAACLPTYRDARPAGSPACGLACSFNVTAGFCLSVRISSLASIGFAFLT